MLTNGIAVYKANNKWPQQKLADGVGISHQTITSIENQKYNPPLILAFKVVKPLDNPIKEILYQITIRYYFYPAKVE